MVNELSIEIRKLKQQPCLAHSWLSMHDSLKAILQDFEHLVLLFDKMSNTESSEDVPGGKAKRLKVTGWFC